MIPYFQQPTLELWGPFAIHGWGVMVCIGIIFGTTFAGRQAKRVGLDPYVVDSYGIWCVVAGFIGAHFVHVLAYDPKSLKEDPLVLFKVWGGFSSFGGFLGAFVGTLIFRKVHKIEFRTYMDSIARGFAPGWMFGRIGCFLAHDHKGIETDFFLGLRWPTSAKKVEFDIAGCTFQPGLVRDAHYPAVGGVHHDLGLYDAMVAGTLWFIAMRMKPEWGRGVIAGTLFVAYGIARFFLDYLRVYDARYGGLTPAQFLCLPLILGGIYFIWLGRKEVAQGYVPYPDAESNAAAKA